MAALIRCHFRFRKKEMEAMDDDEFCELWGQTKYYLEAVHQVEFK